MEGECVYCGTNTKIKCYACDLHYCNNYGNSTNSHIIYHSAKNKHNKITINNKMLNCKKCKTQNIFKLGFLTDQKYDFLNDKICEMSIESNQNIEHTTSEEKEESEVKEIVEEIDYDFLEKLICRDCNETQNFEPVIAERSIVKNLVLSNNEMKNKRVIKEEFKPNYVSTKLTYTEDEYVNINSFLLEKECEQEKMIKEDLKQDNVHVRMEVRKEKRDKDINGSFVDEAVWYCGFNFKDAEQKIKIGDEILIYNSHARIQAFVVQNYNIYDDIRARIYKIRGKISPEDKYYTVEYIWKSVGMERMLNALQNMHRIDDSILKYILGNLNAQNNNDSSDDSDDAYNKQYNTTQSNELIDISSIKNPPNLPFLNPSQVRAVQAALSNPLTLIQGPPGTGKTVTSAAIIYNLIKLKKGKILVVANSNTAMDNLTEKIYKSGVKVVRIVSNRRENIGDKLTFLSLHEQVRISTDYLHQNSTNSDSDDINAHFIKQDKHLKKIREKYEKLILDQAEVVTCTCVTAGQRIFKGKTFENVLIDEAVQCTEPLSIIPLIYGCKKLVLVGDHKQLGPVLLNKDVEKAGFKQSMFERLVVLGVIPYLLNVQYRMHPILSEWPSNQFYNGSLINGITEAKRINKTTLPFPSFFYCCYGKEELSSSGTSYLNQGEALYCESIINNLIQGGIKESQIGVITPYEGQKTFLISKLRNFNIEELEISNVDSFQGREKDYIIVSLVRSNTNQGIGFVNDARRLNVSLTRAKFGCVIIGNPATLIKYTMWKNLLEFYQENERVYEGPINSLKKANIAKKANVDLKALFEALDTE